ncbi:multidrug effflux MFS transporter [Pengzhenrongella sicca]|uniref:Multidrug effflux MFS transporter n=1 Tax=Pengzhenrongella sicca TaxID=2819238 RepID=A0A8A4ZGE7_9MICO|nr:multidrug effflux MFS transporter [Pengzhenrongella sicca]QTE29557.1 multidrug effflux MFS transporter [Pengzhenrongella sicca]
MPPSPVPAPTTPTRIGVGFVLLLSALTAIGPLTFDTYLAAFPEIAQDLSATPAMVQFTLTASLAGLALGQVLIGSLSDAYGRRRPLLAALAIYVAVSAAMTTLDSIAWLTALRFVQGFSAAAGMVLSLAIVRDKYSGIQVSKVIARLMLVVGVAPILAPTIGAQLLQFGSWRMIFGFLAIVGAVLLALASVTLRESLPVERRRTGGTRAAVRTYRDLLTDRPFLGLALLSAFYMSALFTYVAASTFVFQDGFGLDAQQFGFVFAGGAAAITIASQFYGALVGRFEPEQILTAAIAAGLVLATALLIVALAGGGLVPVTALVIGVLATAGFVMPSAPAIALAANPHRAGSAAALLGALQFGIGALVAPLTGLLGGDPVLAMSAVMFTMVALSAALLLVVSRSWRRAAVAGVVAADRTPTELTPADLTAASLTAADLTR